MFQNYLIFVAIMNILTVIIYAIDKIKAIIGTYRIRESVLLLFSFLFGSVGGLFSLYVIRHKNRHLHFVILNWVSLLLHIVITIVVYKYC